MKPFNPKKILVPTDFSSSASNAITQAIHIAKMNGANIKLVHIVTPFYITGSDPLMAAGERFYNSLMRDANAKLKKIAADIKQKNKITVDVHVKLGSITEEICSVVKKEKFDLIVMGTHGTSGVKEFFAGSNAYKVVSHANCPVLTVQAKSSKKVIKNIVLPIRLERNSRQKVDYAVEMARIFNATLLITGYTSEKDKYNRNRVKQYVTQVERYLAKLKIDFKSKLIFSENFTEDIINYATKSKADLIMVMKEHDFSLKQLIKGTYAQQFINHSKVPVLSIPTTSNPDLLVYSPYLSGATPY